MTVLFLYNAPGCCYNEEKGGGAVEQGQILKGYRDDDTLRGSFDRLARRTFDLTFEDWYQNGFWGDDYIPYSVVIDGAVAANVSVNRTNFVLDGETKRFIQLGTVMTDERYRNRGLIRRLMTEIDRDFAGQADGVYLFANDSVLDFYPKFGFRRAAETEYTKAVETAGAAFAEPTPMRDAAAWTTLVGAIRESAPCGRFSLSGNTGLPLFYVSKFMQDCVCRIGNDTYAVAEREGETLCLHAVYAPEPPDLDAVVRAFGAGVRQVRLSFTPQNSAGWTPHARREADTTLFVRGAGFDDFERRGLMLPVLAHA